MFRKTLFICFIISNFFGTVSHTYAQKIDATLSFIIHNPGKNEIKNLIKEFSKNFAVVEPFDITRPTNFYLYYAVSDKNIIFSENSINTNENFVSSSDYAKYLKGGKRTASNRFVSKPYRGKMVLYNSYGTELINVNDNDQYKNTSGALKATISDMRRAINKQKDKMALRQKKRCLFCDFSNLKDNQKKKTTHLAFLVHKTSLANLYGNITENEISSNIVPYANLYYGLKDYKTLEHILDTTGITFNNKNTGPKLPGHLINDAIKANVSETLLNKIAKVYLINEFEELDQNNLTPLWGAIAEQNLPLLRRIINYGADVNKVTKINNNFLTPLMLSMQYGNEATTELLIKNGVKLDFITPNGQSAWTTAMWLGKYNQAALVWPNNTDFMNSYDLQDLFIQSAYYGQLDKLTMLADKGVPYDTRDANGDNAVIAAVKGIKTFAIKPDFKDSGTTGHQIDVDIYWQIIKKIQISGLNNPLKNSIDNNNQTTLFHAYPSGDNSVNDQHINLIAQIIKSGVNPDKVNINGQNADQAYQTSRLVYINELYEIELNKIIEERKNSGINSQENQNKRRTLAQRTNDALRRYEGQKTTNSRSKRMKAMDRATERVREASGGGMRLEFSDFERNNSDVQKGYKNYKRELEIVNEKERDQYINDVKIADDLYQQKKDVLDEIYEFQKAEEAQNKILRNEKINQALKDI